MSNELNIQALIEKKIYNAINNQLKKRIKPNLSFHKVTDLDLEVVKNLKSKYGIGGIILDVDETIRKDMLDIPNCNKKWIDFMRQEFKVVILTNGFDDKIRSFSSSRGIEYMSFARKPLRKNLLLACSKMGLDPENVLMIGDDIIADIYGGNKCGIITAIVNSVIEEKSTEK